MRKEIYKMNFELDHDIFSQWELDEKKPNYIPPISNFDKCYLLKTTANQCLSSLSNKEEKILRMFLGFGLHNQYDCKEISNQFNLSEVEVLQIANQAFYKFAMNYFSHLKELKTH